MYRREVGLHPRVRGDRSADRQRHQRLAHPAVGILGEFLTPFGFRKRHPFQPLSREPNGRE